MHDKCPFAPVERRPGLQPYLQPYGTATEVGGWRVQVHVKSFETKP